MKTLKIILAILLGWSAPIISLIIWIWLFRSKKYQEYSITTKTMWIVFWGMITPLIICLAAIIIFFIGDVVSNGSSSSGKSFEYDDDHYLTWVNFPVDTCEQAENPLPQKTIYVDDEVEFIEALGSNRIVQISNNAELNLTKVLLDEVLFCSEGRRLILESCDIESNSPLVYSEKNYDSQELTLYNISNLTIRASSGAKIVVDDPDATVLEFLNCKNITLENLTIGHTVETSCVGQVVGVEKCNGITIKGCDLYGCGAYGILAYNTKNIFADKSIIRDCSCGTLWLTSCSSVTFNHCHFLRNENGVYIDGDSKDILFGNCVFEGNNLKLFNIENEITLKSCKITHDLTQLGLENQQVVYLDDKTTIHPNPSSN